MSDTAVSVREESPSLAAERAEARARFVASASVASVIGDAVRSRPVSSLLGGAAAGFLAARGRKASGLLVWLARLYLGGPGKAP